MAREISTIGNEFLSGIRRNAGLAIAVGILMIITGILAIGSPLVAGLSVSVFVGLMLLIAGIGRLVLAFRAGSFGRGMLSAIVGIIMAVAGVLMISSPGAGLATLTIFLASYLLIAGIFEIAGSFEIRPAKGWGWTLFSGIVAVLLGFMIWGQFPVSGAWAVGLLVGLQMLFSGIALIMLGSGTRSVVKEVMRKAA
jgi:uncharacterized membrane protein HdeD (DUF308 family)